MLGGGLLGLVGGRCKVCQKTANGLIWIGLVVWLLEVA
jgi:hypothetical protein